MAFFLVRTETHSRKRIPGVFPASRKTLTPGSRLSERGQRFYNPGMGRWLCRDSVFGDTVRSLYSYVDNDPLDWWDSLGNEKAKGDEGQTAGQRIHSEKIVENGAALVKYTLEKGALTEAEMKAVRAQLVTALEYGRTAVAGAATTSGGLTQFPSDLADKLGKNLTKVGDSVKFPVSSITGISLASTANLYVYVVWVQGGAMEKLTAYEAAARVFVAKKSESTCQDVCSTGAAFIAGVPSLGTEIVAGFYLSFCMTKCCDFGTGE